MHQLYPALAIVSGCFAALDRGVTGTFVTLPPELTRLNMLATRLVVALLTTTLNLLTTTFAAVIATILCYETTLPLSLIGAGLMMSGVL